MNGRATPPAFDGGDMAGISGRRVLITGGSGFLGRQVCETVRARGPAAVFAPRKAEYDLRQPDQTRALLRATAPDTVIHLAAVVGGIGANRDQPGRFFYENAAMGLHLMEEARLAGVGKFVAVGTICSYPKHTPVPFKEDALWDGYPEETNAPYGLAKKMLLVQAQAYRRQYGFNAVTLLPVNLYGPGDNFDPTTSHVIPALIKKAIDARDAHHPEIEVWGDGSASREFLFVRDAAEGVVLAAERYDDPDPVNLGSGTEMTVRELVRVVCDLCRFNGTVRWDTSKPNGQPRRCLDTSRARERFGFAATTPFLDGLAETVAWYEQHRKGGAALQ
jgi:GDP-L-fucose synthase